MALAPGSGIVLTSSGVGNVRSAGFAARYAAISWLFRHLEYGINNLHQKDIANSLVPKITHAARRDLITQVELVAHLPESPALIRSTLRFFLGLGELYTFRASGPSILLLFRWCRASDVAAGAFRCVVVRGESWSCTNGKKEPRKSGERT
jgi:hypothetical protein